MIKGVHITNFKKKCSIESWFLFLWRKVYIFVVYLKNKNVNGTVLLFILYSIWVHVERLKYKMICLKSSELATSFNKQWSKILYYVDFIIFNKYSIDFYKIEKFKKYKVTPPVGFEPATSGVWCYETPAQRKLPKTPLTNDILLTILKKKEKAITIIDLQIINNHPEFTVDLVFNSYKYILTLKIILKT